jgi:peptidoglycan/xylan/chitin deacetylase (PgdA/CDA1 family)
MKITTSILAALFLASAATAAMPDDPAKIDTCTKPGVVAWTFDDGPGMYNDKLLKILADKNVKATFFVL